MEDKRKHLRYTGHFIWSVAVVEASSGDVNTNLQLQAFTGEGGLPAEVSCPRPQQSGGFPRCFKPRDADAVMKRR